MRRWPRRARGWLQGKPLGMAIETPAAGYAEMLIALAVDLGRDDNKALPIALTQVARHANPGNSEATILLALLLDGDGRPDDALALLDARSGPTICWPARRWTSKPGILGDKGDYHAGTAPRPGRRRKLRCRAAGLCAAGQCAGRHGPAHRGRGRLWRSDCPDRSAAAIRSCGRCTCSAPPASSRPTAGPRPRPSWKPR